MLRRQMTYHLISHLHQKQANQTMHARLGKLARFDSDEKSAAGLQRARVGAERGKECCQQKNFTNKKSIGGKERRTDERKMEE